MPYGYGVVGISTFAGFIFGIWLQFSQPTNSESLQYIGYLLLAVGLVSMFGNRKAVTGFPGGLLTGVGLGITLASEPGFRQSFSNFFPSAGQ